MSKRVLLAFTFIAVVGLASLGAGSKAQAWSDCGGPGPGYVAAYPAPYYAAPYGSAWGPRLAYYPPVAPVRAYPVYYGRDYDHHHHDHHRSGVTVSFGF